MRAGTLRKAGMLQQQSGARDSFGGKPNEWTDVRRIRYGIQTTAGSQIEAAGAIRAKTTSTVTMRFQPGVEPGMRIKQEASRYEDTVYFNITAVNDVNRIHHELELTVIEDRTASA